MADSNKLLKELSSLSSNFDSLYQELKASAKSNAESSEQVKDLVTEMKKGKSPSGEDLKGIFESFTKSFSKTIADQNDQILKGLTDKISQSFTGSVSNFLGNVPQQIAQVKSGQMPDFKSILGGDSIKGIISNAASKIPGLADGGTVESSGIAVVGEKGPELVELKSGDKVRTKEEQLMEMLLDEERRKNEKLGRVRRTGPTEEEVEAYRKELLAEDPEFYSDPAELQEELDYFRSEQGYDLETRETFSLEDLNKLSRPVSSSEVSSTTETFSLEDLNKLSRPVSPSEVSSTTTTVSDSQELNKSINVNSPDKVGSPEEKNSKFKDLLGKAKEMATEKLKEAQTKATSTISNSVAELKEKSPIVQAKNSAEDIKAQVEEKVASIRESLGKSSNTSETQSSNTPSTQVSSRRTNLSTASSSDSNVGSMSSEDVKEMKSLLAAIYQTLRGPLTIANDLPFRPNSNNF